MCPACITNPTFNNMTNRYLVKWSLYLWGKNRLEFRHSMIFLPVLKSENFSELAQQEQKILGYCFGAKNQIECQHVKSENKLVIN